MYPSAPESLPAKAWLGIGLAFLAVLLLAQNLNPVVSITFLGFVSLPLPLGLAILGSFLVGAVGAGLWNQLAGWVESRRSRSEPSRPPSQGNSLGKGNEVEEDDDDVIEVEYLDQ